MSRYHRVNLDGQSYYKTETYITNAALQPGTFVGLNASKKWVQATTAAVSSAPLYVMGAAEHQGLGITEAVPSGVSGVGSLVEDGRTFAVRVGPGTYKEDQPLVLVDGVATAVPATAGTYAIVGYVQENYDVVVPAATTDFVAIRIAKGYPTITVS